MTLLIGALSAAEVSSAALSGAVGSAAPVLIVLGSLLLGGIAGSLLDIEARLTRDSATGFGHGWGGGGDGPEGVPRDETASGHDSAGTLPSGSPPADEAARERFIEGFVTASLVFCVGPLTILGSLSDGLGRGPIS